MNIYEQRYRDKYGNLAEVMRTIQHWHWVLIEYNSLYNRSSENPVTELDVENAESEMLNAILVFSKIQ